MSSRQEEKERRREERLAAEADAARATARKQRLGIAVGAVIAIAIVAAIVIVVSGGGTSKRQTPLTPSGKTPAIPAVQQQDLNKAVAAAGCKLHTFTPGPNDRNHVTGKVHYKQNPPVFGPHNPTPAHDGDFVGQGTPPTEMLVHALEHGRVEIQYAAGTPARRQSQLETLLNEPFSGKPAGYKQLVFQNETKMPFAVAATTWGQQLGCPAFNDKVFDALRAFRAKFVDQAPEGPNQPFPE